MKTSLRLTLFIIGCIILVRMASQLQNTTCHSKPEQLLLKQVTQQAVANTFQIKK